MRVILAEIEKTMKIWLCYPLLIGFWAVFPLLWVSPFVFQGLALVGGLSSSPFKNLTGTGNYMAFVLIGAMVSTYVFSGLWGVGNSLREETYWGTLEFIYATLMVIFQALICVFLFGVALTLGKLLPILLILVLLLVGFYGFAIAFAGLTLLIKEAHGLVHTMEYVFYLYALVAIRAIMLLNKGFGEVWQVTLILLLIILLQLGLLHLIFKLIFDINGILPSLLVVGLMLIAIYGLGMMIAALALFLQKISHLLPTTYGILTIRHLLIGEEMGFSMATSLFRLAILGMVWVGFGLFIFALVDKKTRREGTLGHY